MTICNDLRQAVLQAAMQGKLTEQLSTDSAVDDFLSSIQSVKNKLREEKKMGKEKDLEPISESDMPFDIPDSWRWVRVGHIFMQSSGKAMNATKANQGEEYDFITTSNLYWNYFDLTAVKRMRFTDTEIEKCTAKKGDLLICEGGDIGRAAIWKYDYDIKLQNHIHRLRACVPTNMMFFYYLFYFYKNANIISGKGIGIQGLSANALRSIAFPVPPIEEQNRIVAKVDELMAKIDELEKTEKALETIKTDFPGDMKASILQAAMQGKLTEQSATDTPVDQLLQSMGLNARTNDDETIPDSWAWLQMQDIVKLSNGIKSSDEKLPYLEARYLRTQTNAKMCDSGQLVEEGTYVILVDGENSGEVFCVPERGYMGSTFKILEVNSNINLDYILNVLLFYKDVLRQSKKGAAIPHLNKALFKNIYIPIPPIEEQQRIVEKLDALLPLCDNLVE